MSRMVFDVSTLGYIQNTQSIILDYAINIKNLRRNDQMFDAGALGNFSLAGFEMVIFIKILAQLKCLAALLPYCPKLLPLHFPSGISFH